VTKFILTASVTFEAENLGDAAAKLAAHFEQISDEYYNGPDATKGCPLDMISGGVWLNRVTETTDGNDPA
jgi:hypothetical protein